MEKLPEEKGYCRRCQEILPVGNFYDCTDSGFIDKNLKMSVCKNCVNEIYDELYSETKSIEKTLHKMCTSLNVKFSNEAVSATRANIDTLVENGKTARSIFGIYKSRLLSAQKTMDKNALKDMTYEDVGTIYTQEEVNLPEIAIPQTVIDFWGMQFPREDIIFLEREYTNFKQTHKADTYAEIVLLKEVCYTILDIRNKRLNGDNTDKEQKTLQDLMKNLTITPNTTKDVGSKDEQILGLWIKDIEENEPAEWLKTDPRGDMYRDVGNVEQYFEKFLVRPLKNFILNSRDFNIDDDIKTDEEWDVEEGDLILVNKED